MPRFETIALSGTIQHVFAHRFTLEAGGDVHLADLTPKGVLAFPINVGLAVSLTGERRPSEIKVTRIGAEGRGDISIEHNKPHHEPGHKHANVPPDLGRVLAAVREAGWEVEDEPRRKPKHFEMLASRDGAALCELHVDFAGTIYKQRAVDPVKWSIDA